MTSKLYIGFIFATLIIIVSVAYYGNITSTQLISYTTESKNELSEKIFFSSKYQQSKQQTVIEPKASKFKYNFLERYPGILDCPVKDGNIKDWTFNQSSIPTNNDNYNFSAPAPSSTHDSRIVRGILVYFPIERSEEFKLEFKWMYRSWIEMLKYEPAKWRTDLIVFIDNDNKTLGDKSFFLNELNCSFAYKRTSKLDKPMCTLIEYVAIKNRVYKDANGVELNPYSLMNISFKMDDENSRFEAYHHLLNKINIFDNDTSRLNETIGLLPFYTLMKSRLSNYGYLDSIVMAFEGYHYLKNAHYDFLIRSDMDVFLTPLFGTWLPRYCNDFYVGRGGYSTPFNVDRLKRIANDLEFEYAAVMNLGSTWYSTPDQFRLVSYMTLFGMLYLSEEEFSPPEREGKLGVMLWPYWHFGVLLLYGQNIALNHLIATKQLNVVKLEQHFDYPSYFDEDIHKMLHIHVFHGDSMFSKFQFKAGKYDQMNYTAENTNLVKFYSLKMALEGKFTPAYDLYKMFWFEANRKT